ncbi:MAG TPA: AsmA-like C-terminal region-containing protein [Candidatus Limnocylindria bacterium]|nr:AsmA-like C-terminal region-containing protein [Candidatus Limnocylindria bacterium]
MSRPPSRRPRRLALAILTGALVVMAAAWVALTIVLPPARVQEIVRRQVSTALAREVRFAGASVGILPLVRLTVREPALAEPGGFGRGAAFQARSLHLDLDAWALLRGRTVVRRLVFDEPSLHLVLREDGTTNLDSLARSVESGRAARKPMDFDVRELAIRNGRILVDDLPARRRTTFGIESKLELSSAQSGTRFATSGTTTLSELAIGALSASRRSELNQGLAKLRWRIEHRGVFDQTRKRLALERLTVALGAAEVRLEGVVDEPGPKANLALRVRGNRVDLGDVLDYLAVADAKALRDIQGDGELEFDLTVRGRLAPGRLPAITGHLRVARGSFRYPGAPAGVEGLAFHARFAPDSLRIPDLRARVSGQPVQAQLAVTRFADPWVVFAVQGDVDLAVIGPLVAPKDTKLGGHAALNVSGRGRSRDPGSVALAGRARLRGVTVESKQLPKRIERLEGDIQFSPQRAEVSGLSARAGRSSFTLDATVTRPLALLANPKPESGEPVPPAGVDFSLRSPYLDLKELLPATPGAPLVPNATGGGRVEIAQLKNQKLDVADVLARVTLEPGIVSVPEFTLQGYGGTVAGNARIDLTNPKQPDFSFKAEAQKVQAGDVLATWTGAKDFVRGVLDMDINLSGEGADRNAVLGTLTAAGLALFADGQIGPGPVLEGIARATRIEKIKDLRFKDLKLPFRVERGRVITDEATIDGPYGKWVTSGGVSFEGALDYAVSITLSPEVVDRLGGRASAAAMALADGKGNLLLDLRVTGTAKSPRVALDGASMRNRLLGKASDALEEQKQKLQDELRAALEAREKAVRDSVRGELDRRKKALEDSLKRRARDILQGFFREPKDTTGP